MCSEWSIEEFVRDKADVDLSVAKNLVALFKDENTVPFIARYRKKETGDLAPEKIRSSLLVWQEAKSIKSKVATLKTKLDKEGKGNGQICALFDNAKSMDEVEALFAPFKGESKKSLAAKARAKGLETPAMDIVAGQHVRLNTLLDQSKDLKDLAHVELGIQHIIADHIHRQVDTMDFLRRLASELAIRIHSSKSKAADKNDEAKSAKFQDYFKFESLVRFVKPHQILALNRGEKNKILCVKVVVPEQGLHKFRTFVNRRYFGSVAPQHKQLVSASVDDCYNRLFEPQLSRMVRSSLIKEAHRASVQVFVDNLRQLLLTPPVKDCAIIGIDPGFRHGCKCALINNSGQVMDTGIFLLPECKGKDSFALIERFRRTASKAGLKQIKIAIGNGTACRQTESLISDLLAKNAQLTDSKLEYCIVNETGSSEYSVTELAKKELAAIEPNLRSAVSIARRLQDPLAELVKIEPKHLGVGMYQHDLNEKLLKENLDLVVQECVSFVGVDINTCSVELLQNVAGMTRARAASVDAYKVQHGPFTNRQQLLDVKGVGKKVFEQCAGFVKIFPSANSSCEEPKRKKRKLSQNNTNPLDATFVHPESYDFAKSLIQFVGFNVSDVGTTRLISALKSLPEDRWKRLCENTDEFTAKHVLESLTKPVFSDLREEKKASDLVGPVFRHSVRSLADVREGESLSGVVCNVTPFGAFVDVGVGQDGLIHKSNLQGRSLGQLQVGSRVVTYVLNVDLNRKRLGLRLDAIN